MSRSQFYLFKNMLKYSLKNLENKRQKVHNKNYCSYQIYVIYTLIKGKLIVPK